VLLTDGAPTGGAGRRLLAELLVSLVKGVNVGGGERAGIVNRGAQNGGAQYMPFWQPLGADALLKAVWQVFDEL